MAPFPIHDGMLVPLDSCKSGTASHSCCEPESVTNPRSTSGSVANAPETEQQQAVLSLGESEYLRIVLGRGNSNSLSKILSGEASS